MILWTRALVRISVGRLLQYAQRDDLNELSAEALFLELHV